MKNLKRIKTVGILIISSMILNSCWPFADSTSTSNEVSSNTTDDDNNATNEDSNVNPETVNVTSSDIQKGYYAPIYDTTETLSIQYEADLSEFTTIVIANQHKGARIARLVPDSSGTVTLDSGETVQLIDLYKKECPSEIPNCDVTDSATLGVGSTALIKSYDELLPSIKNQGERGTCVSFALNAGTEILIERKKSSANLSEQDTYYWGKRVENSWDSSGLFPDVVISEFISQAVPFVDEDSWPYNRENKDCAEYSKDHPGFFCSETEAQGGGDDGKVEDPHADAFEGQKIITSHALYASLGRIKQALYRGYPTILSINANSDFTIATKKQGTVSWVFEVANCEGSPICGHAILAVGYADDPNVEGGGYIIIKNSWDSSWGNDGLAYLTYTWIENSLLDANALVEVE